MMRKLALGDIKSLIFEFRGLRVMIDTDLASLSTYKEIKKSYKKLFRRNGLFDR